jgi:hypothetical protein
MIENRIPYDDMVSYLDSEGTRGEWQKLVSFLLPFVGNCTVCCRLAHIPNLSALEDMGRSALKRKYDFVIDQISRYKKVNRDDI